MKKVYVPFLVFLVLVTCLIVFFISRNIANRDNAPAVTEAGSSQDLSEVTDGTAEDEAAYSPADDPDYKSVGNARFNFWFDIPNDWKAINKSANNDGYFFVTDNVDADVRIYGTLKTGVEEDYYNTLSGKKGRIEDFHFKDGKLGKKITNVDSNIYYVRIDGDIFINFYVNCDMNASWYKQNKDKLEYVAASLRPGTGSAEKDKITVDDLKLGAISIDMPYEDIGKAMKAKLVKDDNSELESTGGRTLFYEDGTEIYVLDGSVNSVNVNDSSYATPRGLKVGDDTNKLKQLYGEPDNINDNTHWGYTIDGYELFSIVLKDGRVAEIQIDMTV